MPSTLSVVGLTRACVVYSTVVHHSPGLTIGLGHDKHPMLPDYRFIERDTSDDTKSFVSVQSSFNSLLPVQCHLGWCVDSVRFGLWVNMQLHGDAVVDERELLALACVEGRASESFKDVSLQLGKVFFDRRTG